MAKRPVFVVLTQGEVLIDEIEINFQWYPGMSYIQRTKNITSLHQEAKKHNISNILEISSKSENEIGRRLSAFNLKLNIDNKDCTLESVYQGSKVFEQYGPFPELFSLPPREAKKFIKEGKFGRLTQFKMNDRSFPIFPRNVFYDWVYINALKNHEEWIRKHIHYTAFTDIEYNPKKQINCQARAFAEYISLSRRGHLQEAANDFHFFTKKIMAHPDMGMFYESRAASPNKQP